MNALITLIIEIIGELFLTSLGGRILWILSGRKDPYEYFEKKVGTGRCSLIGLIVVINVIVIGYFVYKSFS